MGTIAQQSTKNFIWSNLGIIVGSVYTLALVPKAFNNNPEFWGLIQLLLYYSQILMSVVILSIPTIILRYYPQFSERGRKNEFFSASLFLLLAGCLVVSIIFLLIGKPLGKSNYDDELYARFYWIIVPVLIFSVLFELYAAWSKARLKSTVPSFLKESFLKLCSFIVIVLYFFHIIGNGLFLFLYFFSYAIQAFLIFWYTNKSEKIRIIPRISLIREIYSKDILSFMGFNVLGTATYVLMNKIDVLMIGKMLSLEYVSYYSIALALIAFVQLPEKSISAISVPSLSHFINNNDMGNIRNLYKKTSLNQFILSAFIFLGIWVNIDNVNFYLGEKFGNIEYVVLYLGLAKLVDVITGLNGPLIAMSKYYRIAFWLQVFLVIMLFVSNIILIPKYGIDGAAFGSFVSICLYNLLKTIFVYSKYNIWPFTWNTAGAMVIAIVSLILVKIIPENSNFWLDLTIKSFSLTVIYFILIIGFRISEDINSIQKHIFKQIFNK